MTAPGPRPQRLPFITVPLLIQLVLNGLSLLLLPFAGGFVNTLLDDYARQTGTPATTLPPEAVTSVLWVAFALTAAFVLLLYFTRRAVLEGRSWGRIVSIVLGVLSLLSFPLGTVLGIFMLIGAFDRDVQRYTSR
ncbi:hypothetical protein DAETH_03720 [Deinococcus aetherius]|uniref:DUF4064 domain-containing protein n=1 Tax=Deinococcus aetherius TaxID=200252 RepID=A0ABM8A9N7_9DEIO|nr:hypothetical protein [Deinococcus aetherius]BDP40403.1 hypothetical protein DAETH_03720 [Deinococcus aetherius]